MYTVVVRPHKMPLALSTWWFIPRIVSGLVHPSYKWTLPPLIPFITRVITHLLSGMNHQALAIMILWKSQLHLRLEGPSKAGGGLEEAASWPKLGMGPWAPTMGRASARDIESDVLNPGHQSYPISHILFIFRSYSIHIPLFHFISPSFSHPPIPPDRHSPPATKVAHHPKMVNNG